MSVYHNIVLEGYYLCSSTGFILISLWRRMNMYLKLCDHRDTFLILFCRFWTFIVYKHVYIDKKLCLWFCVYKSNGKNNYLHKYNLVRINLTRISFQPHVHCTSRESKHIKLSLKVNRLTVYSQLMYLPKHWGFGSDKAHSWSCWASTQVDLCNDEINFPNEASPQRCRQKCMTNMRWTSTFVNLSSNLWAYVGSRPRFEARVLVDSPERCLDSLHMCLSFNRTLKFTLGWKQNS